MLWQTLVMYFAALTMLHRICEATRVDTVRLFSVNLPDILTLTVFHGVTITECEDRCFLRKRCSGVLYNRLSTTCTLTDLHRNDQRLNENKGTVYAVGFKRLRQALSTGICRNCTDDQTCLSTEMEQTCKIIECGEPPSIYTEFWGNMFSVNNMLVVQWEDKCGPPPSIYTEYWGNMFSVNNTLVVHWEGKNSSIICGEDGQWAAIDTPCLPGMAHFDSSCFHLVQILRAHPDAKSFCEQLTYGAHLADTKTPAAVEFARSWLAQSSVHVGILYHAGVWLGGEKNALTNEFEWSDGTPLAESAPWDFRQPQMLATEKCLAATYPAVLFHDASYSIRSDPQ